jgi:hypothetical protein
MINNSMKRKGAKRSNLIPQSRPKQGMLPPVVPQSAKNGNQTSIMEVDNGKSYSLSKTMIIGNRSISAGRP